MGLHATTVIDKPFFWQRVSKDVCPVCAQHSIVVIQACGPFYVLHTYAAKGMTFDRCIHRWTSRENDPRCLNGFEPTKRQPKLILEYENLAMMLERMRIRVRD